MLPSNEKITVWLKEGQDKGALEVMIGLDTYFLTPAGVEPQDDDYFAVFVMPRDNHGELMKKNFSNSHVYYEGTYKIPKSDERLKELGVKGFQIEDRRHLPTYLINNILYPNRFGKSKK